MINRTAEWPISRRMWSIATQLVQLTEIYHVGHGGWWDPNTDELRDISREEVESLYGEPIVKTIARCASHLNAYVMKEEVGCE